MSSNAPELPSSGWRVIYEDAVRKYIAEHPLDQLRHGPAVADWIVAVRESGPTDGIVVGDDLHLSVIGGNVIAEYMVISSEYLVIVKRFLPA